MTDQPTLADLVGQIVGLSLDDDEAGYAASIDEARLHSVAGAYARRAARAVDPEVAAAAARDLATIGALDLDLIAAAMREDAPPRRDGIDWEALGLTGRPGFLDDDDPALAALAAMEPPMAREWRKLAEIRGGAQLPPDGDWLYWLIMAGRGFGKSWTGANVLAEWAVQTPGDYALVAPTFGDAQKICVEEKRSGLLTALGDDLVNYNKSSYIVHVRGGSRIILGSSDSPNRLRGYNFSGAWLDELASYVNLDELWGEVLVPALRIEGAAGELPRAIITTTPKRGNSVLTELLDRHKHGDATVAVTRGRTSDNAANLSAAFMRNIYARYAGTSTGRQELDGELLDFVDGALVSMLLIEATRIRAVTQVPELRRIVVGVDPAVSDSSRADQCGIIVMGIGGPPVGSSPKHQGEHLYVLEDATLRAHPETWARRVLEVAASWGADAIYAEANNGGAVVETMVRLVAKGEAWPMPRYYPTFATRGKLTRAEPMSGVWQQGRVHVVGAMPGLEDRWTSWVPGSKDGSPDELDASVWAGCGLMPELSMKPGTEIRIIA